METKKIVTMILKAITMAIMGYVTFSADEVYAISAEYKCTNQCSLCIDFAGKKTVCSEKYDDDSEEYEKAKKIARFVNDGLIVPSQDIKTGFKLEEFQSRFFNFFLMVKKAAQIAEATKNMCVRKTVKYEKTVLVPRSPTSSNGKTLNDVSKGKTAPKKSKYSE